MPDSVINFVHRLSRHNKDGFVYTYNDNVIIPDDVPNDPHDNNEASDDNNDSDYVHDDDESSDDKNDYDSIDTVPMSSTDNAGNPPYTDDASYGEPISGV